MFKELMLASHGYFGGFYGGTVGELLASWEQAGVFSYVIPFLLIFAVVFGILSQMNLFKQKGIHAVIALTVSLLALQFSFVPYFFSEIFPRLGVGIAVILIFMILLGLFMPNDKKWFNWLLFVTGIAIFIIILFQTFGRYNYGFSNFWYWVRYNWAGIVGIIAFFAVLGAVINSGKQLKYPNVPTPETVNSP